MAKDEKYGENNGVKEKVFDFSTLPMKLESDMKKFSSGYADKMKKLEKFEEVKKNAPGCGDYKNAVRNCRNENRGNNVNVHASERQFSVAQVENGNHNLVNDENFVVRKRKRDCCLGMLNWICTVAKDPCNPVIGSLPESHKWKSYGTELKWKQILSIRQAMLSEKNVDASSQLIWQRIQKMHPVMYDDQSGPHGLRSSQRIATVKGSSRKVKETSTTVSSSSGYQNGNVLACDSVPEKEIPIGPNFQAELPEFVGADYKSDSKWVGTRIWPISKGEQTRTFLIERDPIGKGRQESCGCQFPGSLECYRFHIKEKRTKVRHELGSAFYLCKFERMGEEVALTWNKKDEIKFQEIVKSNLLSNGKYFWEELFKVFSCKGREALVSYYFNVFLLRRRGDQNRNKTGNICSDDDESEYGPIANRFGQKAGLSPGSIFRSPKKPHPNSS